MQYIKILLTQLKSRENRALILFVLVLGVIFGLILNSGHENMMENTEDGTAASVKLNSKSQKKEQTWTCSMHPQIRQPKPGKCPLCAMDLIPADSGDADTGSGDLKLSERAVRLAGIRVSPVERRSVVHRVALVGKVTTDERQVNTISSRIAGRIDRMYVDYTGIPVRKGDHLVSVYSPELVSAQQELILMSKRFKRFPSGTRSKEIAGQSLKAARDKLNLLGLTPLQIRKIEKRESPQTHLTLYSPMAGIVIEKKLQEGAYVDTGTIIYTVANLKNVWVKVDVYESDLIWIRYGQRVKFETEAYPGMVFEGRVAFIAPMLDQRTRTVKVRINVPNKGMRLKPGMFVRARIESRLSEQGSVIDRDLSGKWISPMHPEIVKSGPGRCDICGMALVRAESLGYSSGGSQVSEPLVIPVSAPLITGKRAVVYIEDSDEKGRYKGVEIKLGPRAGDYYIVKAGINEGDKVVVNGAFKIDADLQILAKPSMMSGAGERDRIGGGDKKGEETKAGPHIHLSELLPNNIPPSFKKSVDAIAAPYFEIGHELSSDSIKSIKSSLVKLSGLIDSIQPRELSGSNLRIWKGIVKTIKEASEQMGRQGSIKKIREIFESLNTGVTLALTHFGTGTLKVYRFHCPMAFNDKGAYWLQDNTDTRNPYFGSEMLMCKDKMDPLYPEGNDK